MYKRTEIETIKKRMLEPRRFIQVLSGPRQVGKTTLVKQALQDLHLIYHSVTADATYSVDSNWIRQEWQNARLMLKQSGANELLLVIDEVQKVSNWSEWVKKEWDSDSFADVNIKVVLLGSSRLLLQQGLTESLAGRFELLNITHWSYPEMRDAFGFSLDQYIYFGGYPGAATLIHNEERWKDYIRDSLVETSIAKDILLLTRVDKPVLLKRLFDIGCRHSAKILSLTKIQGELQEKGNLTTLAGYLTLLREAGLLCGLEKYASNIIRKRASKPKFQVFNNALLTAGIIDGFAYLRANHKRWGYMVESAVGAYLLNSSLTGKFNVYYWNNGDYEVDYVLEKGDRLVSIEVKSGLDSSNSGIALFDNEFHPHAHYTIGTDGIPFEVFFTMNPVALFSI